MALTISLVVTSVGPSTADTTINGQITVTNSGTNTISLQQLQVFEQSTMGATIRQPDFLTPNVAPGTYPSITASGSATYPFSVVVCVPNTPGDSAQASGGPVPNGAFPASNAVLSLGAFAMGNDAVAASNVTGTTGTQPLLVPLSPAVAPAISLGGALQFNVANNAVNWFFF